MTRVFCWALLCFCIAQLTARLDPEDGSPVHFVLIGINVLALCGVVYFGIWLFAGIMAWMGMGL